MLDIVMRQLRREVMTALIVRDLSARADFQEVVSTVTALAEETVSAAVRVHSRKLAQRFGVPMGVSGAPRFAGCRNGQIRRRGAQREFRHRSRVCLRRRW